MQRIDIALRLPNGKRLSSIDHPLTLTRKRTVLPAYNHMHYGISPAWRLRIPLSLYGRELMPIRDENKLFSFDIEICSSESEYPEIIPLRGFGLLDIRGAFAILQHPPPRNPPLSPIFLPPKSTSRNDHRFLRILHARAMQIRQILAHWLCKMCKSLRNP